jgi:acetyl esterase/lipase
MIFKKIDICEKYPDANVTFYLHEEPSDPRPMIVVCPGGGYHFLSGREAAPIAEYYYNAGFNACILRYSIAPKATNYAPLIQVALTVKYVREHAAEMNIAENKIFTCGFSAGGHLAASAGILWNIPEVKAAMGDAREGINLPAGMVLA